jgi:hypothetical protein
MRKQLRQPITVADPISRTTHMPRHPLRSRLLAVVADESGSVTAEYAIATMAAVGFAGLLVVILRGDEGAAC